MEGLCSCMRNLPERGNRVSPGAPATPPHPLIHCTGGSSPGRAGGRGTRCLEGGVWGDLLNCLQRGASSAWPAGGLTNSAQVSGRGGRDEITLGRLELSLPRGKREGRWGAEAWRARPSGEPALALPGHRRLCAQLVIQGVPIPQGARHVPSLPAVPLRPALGVWRRGAASRGPFREEGPEALESRGVRSHDRRPEGSLQKYLPRSRPVLSAALQETHWS